MRALSIGLAVLFAASFGGGLHLAFDSFAVLRIPLGVGLLACLVLASLRHGGRNWLLALGLSGILVTPFLASGAAPVREKAITIYQKNLGFWNTEVAALAEDIRAFDVDVVTLQEVSPANEGLLTALAEDYPYQVRCDFGELYSMAVLSRLPPGSASPVCSEERGLAALEVDGGWIVSLHLHWPWPFKQPKQLPQMQDILAGLDGPVIIAGDFNQVPWSHAVRSTSRLIGAEYAGPGGPTFFHRGLSLPIDHVLAPTGSTERLDYLGSDHRGLLGRVSFQ